MRSSGSCLTPLRTRWDSPARISNSAEIHEGSALLSGPVIDEPTDFSKGEQLLRNRLPARRHNFPAKPFSIYHHGSGQPYIVRRSPCPIRSALRTVPATTMPLLFVTRPRRTGFRHAFGKCLCLLPPSFGPACVIPDQPVQRRNGRGGRRRFFLRQRGHFPRGEPARMFHLKRRLAVRLSACRRCGGLRNQADELRLELLRRVHSRPPAAFFI